jgi:hypothetical protein
MTAVLSENAKMPIIHKGSRARRDTTRSKAKLDLFFMSLF